MDASTVVSLISSLGFPIFCCVAFGFFAWTAYKDHRDMDKDSLERITQLSEKVTQLAESIAAIAKDVNQNTSTLIQLVDFMRGEKS